MAVLTTASGYDRCVSIVAVTNNKDYLKDVQELIASVELIKPAIASSPTETNKLQTEQQNSVNTPLPAKQDGFAFTTSNFDDGWTSTVQEDWVEVIKGNTKVLLHYPKEGTIFSADPEPLTQAAWNILVAPRYSNLNNFGTSTITSYQRPYLGFGYATDNSTGKEMYIVIFHQVQTGWLEVITKDKNSFKQQYKFDPESTRWDSETDLLNPLIAMFSYNKFAVAASDFTGK